MTAKEKAKELLNKYFNYADEEYYETTPSWELNKNRKQNAKQCALIAVDEILNQFKWKPSSGLSYWEEVKQEINKL
jgi:hypothetical protein